VSDWTAEGWRQRADELADALRKMLDDEDENARRYADAMLEHYNRQENYHD